MPFAQPKAAAKKTIPIKPLTSWSFSRYSDYKSCPLKCKLKHIDKIAEPPNPAMQRGADIHDEAANYIKGEIAKLPASLVKFTDDFKFLRNLHKRKTELLIVEDQWAFTKEWDETQWNNWAECWVRIKLDAAHGESVDNTLYVTDWKTGKYSEYKKTEYNEQLELYALAALLQAGIANKGLKVIPRLGWIDEGFYTYPADDKGEEIFYTAVDVKQLKAVWERRVKPMMADTRFAPKANGTCKWCFYGQAGKLKGGPNLCKY